MIVALDFEDAYNRVTYTILMLNMEVDPTLIIWFGAALLKRNIALQIGPWAS